MTNLRTTLMYASAAIFLAAMNLTAQGTAEDVSAMEPEVANRRVTLNVDKGDIADALRMVAKQGGLNISIGPGVEGEVSVYMTDAPLTDVLRAIAIDNGFSYTVENGVISVAKEQPERQIDPGPPPLVTRVFTLRCQDASRVKDALKYALTQYGKMEVLNENSSTPWVSTSLSSLAGDIDDDDDSISLARERYNDANRSNSNAATNEPAKNARFLVVTDTAENMPSVADLIADLDNLPPQVLIEARLVEMTTQLQRELGIDWNVDVLANGPILNHEVPVTGRAGFASGSQIRRSTVGAASSVAGLALGTIDFTRFTGLLRAHATDNAMRLLANPRLLVFNNTSASILVGERYPILEATITDQGTVTEAFDTYIPVGVQLQVMPTIMNDGRISLRVNPATSSLGDNVVGTTGLTVRRITTRELNTRVIMQDGQTIVLGGLISDRKTRAINKVPGLGDLPVFSAFFRQENPASERVDLLIFLTAHVELGETINERDLEVLEKYRPHFKQIQRLQDVQLHFEAPSEYEPPKPMYGDPVKASAPQSGEGDLEDATATKSQPASPAKVEAPRADAKTQATRGNEMTQPRFKSHLSEKVMPKRRGTMSLGEIDGERVLADSGAESDETP